MLISEEVVSPFDLECIYFEKSKISIFKKEDSYFEICNWEETIKSEFCMGETQKKRKKP